MPITPLHGLAFMFLYFKNKRLVDPLALAVSTTLMDLEPIYYFLLGEPLTHRVSHGFTLALTVYPLLVTLGVYFVEHSFEDKLWAAYEVVRLNPVKVKYPPLNIYLISIFGGFSHVLFDMFTHKEMFWVLYPLTYGNPFYTGQTSIIIGITVILLTFYSLICWLKDKPIKLSTETREGLSPIGVLRNQKPKEVYSKRLYFAKAILVYLRVQCDER